MAKTLTARSVEMFGRRTSDIVTRFNNGLINADDVIAELEENLDFIIKINDHEKIMGMFVAYDAQLSADEVKYNV